MCTECANETKTFLTKAFKNRSSETVSEKETEWFTFFMCDVYAKYCIPTVERAVNGC